MDGLDLIRQFKIGPFAIFDTVAAFVGMYLLAPLLTKIFLKINLNVPRSSVLWFTVPVSILFHIVFNQNTPLMKLLLPPNVNYVVVLVLVIMMYMGMRNVHRVR